MVHKQFYKELLKESTQEIQEDSTAATVEVKSLKQFPESRPSSDAEDKPKEAKPLGIINSWFSFRSAGDLRALQNADPDIKGILNSKIAGKKPTSQEMVTGSLQLDTTRSYGIHL